MQVPYYAIFDPHQGILEVYQLNEDSQYQLQKPDENQRYWIEQLNLYLGIWQGVRQQRDGLWLRWWNQDHQLLLWSAKLALRETQRANRLEAQLRDLGHFPVE